MRAALICFALVASAPALASPANANREPSDYVSAAFGGQSPPPATLWISGDLRDRVEAALGHPFALLRVRYWRESDRTVWVLDEVGKELPITVGVTVTGDTIDDVSVLAFRESRGWEVRYPFFTRQFRNAGLAADGRLDCDIDGITGATLSVRAVIGIARIALMMHEQVQG